MQARTGVLDLFRFYLFIYAPDIYSRISGQTMPKPPTVTSLANQLKRRGVRLNTLHAALRIPYLDERVRSYSRDRDQRIIKLVAMLGGVRAPDLVRISGLTQPTLWRLVDRLQRAGAIRVVTTYRDHVPGRQATSIQPPGSPDRADERRAYLAETAELIRAYNRLWQDEQARATFERHVAEGLVERW